MKQSDLNQAPRILAMIQALTDEECTSVEICNDNPDPSDLPDCVINFIGIEPEDSEDFRGDTLAECLEKALASKGKKVPIGASADWAGRYSILFAAVRDLLAAIDRDSMIERCLPNGNLRRLREAIEAKPELGNWRSQVPRLTDEEVAAWEERWGITGGVSETELRTLAEDIRTL